MRVQLVSDLHLERRPLAFEAVVDTRLGSEVLVLAGDIGYPYSVEYGEFLDKCHGHFKYVIVICGNHEYRTSVPRTMETVDAHMAALCDTYKRVPGHRVIFLNQGKNVVLDGKVNFVGATLWSHIPVESIGPEHLAAMNQWYPGLFVREGVPMKVDTMNALFRKDLAGIEAGVKRGREAGLTNVVVTHHAPVLRNMYKVQDLPRDYLYGTELTGCMGWEWMQYWMYGHSHWNTLNNVKGTTCVCNQYGHRETPCRGWNPSFFVCAGG